MGPVLSGQRAPMFAGPFDEPLLRESALGGGIDLSLLSDARLRQSVDPNPWREHERLATGRPGEIGELAGAFARAGGDLDLAHRFSTEAQQLIGASYTNNGAPVYGPDDHIGRIPQNFPDAGTQLVGLARRLDVVADELNQRIRDAATAVDELVSGLDQMRDAWRTEVNAATGVAGLIPFDKLQALISRRDALRAEQRTRVSTAGGTVRGSIGEYEGHLQGVMRMLADVGYLPPDGLDAGPGDLDFTAGSGTAAANDVTDAVNSGPNPALLAQVDSASTPVALLNAKVAAGGALTHDETGFLHAYYDRLAGSGTFARLEGAVEAAAPMAYQSSPGGDRAINHTLGTVANGLMNLSNVDNGTHVPASVHGLLDRRLGGSGTALFDGQPIRTRQKTSDGWFIPGLAEYEGTAGLISHTTVDGGTEFTRQLGESALRAKQDLNSATNGALELRVDGERPMNDLLGVVARDVDASQALFGDTDDRHVLLGADWTDGSGAAAVLTSATSPMQATPMHAAKSGELAQTLFTELGEDPVGWREHIPKGGDVSNAVTELVAARIDTFAYPTGSTALVQDPQQNLDGTWTAEVRLHSNRMAAQGDDRIDFLKFLATGTDPTDPSGDADIQRIRTAADARVVQELSDALRSGGSPLEPLRHLGDLDGVITRSQYEALLDRGTADDDAAARAYSDRVFAVTAIERVLSATATGPLPSPLGSQIKDPFNVAFDSVLAQLVPPPDLTAQANSTSLLDGTNQDHVNHRSYLIVTAKHEAGLIGPDAYPALFDDKGAFLPFDQLALQGRDPLGQLRDAAAAAPPGVTDWAGGLVQAQSAGREMDPLPYQAEADPDTPVDNREFQTRLRYGSP
jgi:hypothetical protein